MHHRPPTPRPDRGEPDRGEEVPALRRAGPAGPVIGMAVVAVAAGTVAGFDALLTARVHAGTDTALRLSVILPYLGVDPTYVLARAFGLTALVFTTGAVAVGLETGRRRSADRAVPPGAARLHRYLGLVAVVLTALHATVPYASAVAPYGGWATALVPFAQPRSSFGTSPSVYESLGIISFYLAVLAGPSWYLAGRARAWPAVHRVTLAVYVLAVVHALFLGSDFYLAGPVRVALVAVQVPVCVLAALRVLTLWRAAGLRWAAVAAGGLAAGSLALAVAAGLGASGAPLGGFRL